ncbi:MAG: hypothetical protein ABIJ27_06650, partial [Candidatus Omnitrophota bacterium]
MAKRSHRSHFFVFFVALIIQACPHAAFSDESAARMVHKIERDMLVDGDYESSIKKLGALEELYPGSPAILSSMGVAHYGVMEYSTARRCMKEALAGNPDKDLKKFLHHALDAMEESRDRFIEMEELKDNHVTIAAVDLLTEHHMVMITALLREKYFYPSLVAAHISWLKRNNKNFNGLRRLSGDVYYSAMMYREARKEYKLAIEEDPKNAKLNTQLSDCLVAIGDFDAADARYGISIDLLNEQGNGAEAARLRRIKDALPRKYNDVDTLLAKQLYDEAERLCRKRLSLNPGDYVSITQLGEVYWQRFDRKRGMKLFAKVVREAPEYPYGHFYMGRGLIYEKKYDRGMKEFSIYKEKMEGLPSMDKKAADSYVSSLRSIAYLCLTMKRYDDAMNEYRHIIGFDKDDQRAHYNMAVIYYRHVRDRRKTYEKLLKVIDIDSSSEIAGRAQFF